MSKLQLLTKTVIFGSVSRKLKQQKGKVLSLIAPSVREYSSSSFRNKKEGETAKLNKMATISVSNVLEDARATNEGKEVMDGNYILIDIGANLTNKKFSRDVDSVVQRAKESGVQKIMVSKLKLSNCWLLVKMDFDLS